MHELYLVTRSRCPPLLLWALPHDNVSSGVKGWRPLNPSQLILLVIVMKRCRGCYKPSWPLQHVMEIGSCCSGHCSSAHHCSCFIHGKQLEGGRLGRRATCTVVRLCGVCHICCCDCQQQCKDCCTSRRASLRHSDEALPPQLPATVLRIGKV